MAGARGPVRIDLQLQHTNQIAVNGLDTFIYRFGNTGFFAGGRNQPTHFHGIGQQFCRWLSRRGRSSKFGENAD